MWNILHLAYLWSFTSLQSQAEKEESGFTRLSFVTATTSGRNRSWQGWEVELLPANKRSTFTNSKEMSKSSWALPSTGRAKREGKIICLLNLNMEPEHKGSSALSQGLSLQDVTGKQRMNDRQRTWGSPDRERDRKGMIQRDEEEVIVA